MLIFSSFTGTTILSSAYGIPVDDPHNVYLELSRKALHALSEAAITGTYPIDTFFMLKYVSPERDLRERQQMSES